jgi:RHS repeat-associated protein
MVAACVMAVLVPSVARAQADFEKGYQAYQSYHGTDFDTINLANGNLVLNIPLLSYEQRGGLPPVTISIRSNSTTFQSDPPFSSGPLDTQMHEVPSGELGSPAGQPHVMISPGGLYWKEQRITLEKAQVSRFVAIDDSGATHSLGQNIANSSAPYIGNIRYSVDGSDLMLTAATAPLIVDRKGNIGGLIDPNGNKITLQGPCAQPAGAGQFYNPSLPSWESYAYGTASATQIVDSIGRVIPNPTYVPPLEQYNCLVDTDTAYYPANTSVNNASCPAAQSNVAYGTNGAAEMASETWEFPGEGGVSVPLTFCYQRIQLQLILRNVSHTTTTFDETWAVLTAAILPNGTQWVFTYDTWGQVVSVTMPTGATISYTYDNNDTGTQATRLACGNPPGEIPVAGTPTWPFNNLMSSRMVTGRKLSITNPDGSSSAPQWTYSSTIGSGWEGSSNSGTVNVTDPLGNVTSHLFSLIGPTSAQPICGPYETQTNYYQGSSTPLKQVSTLYSSVGTDQANPTNFSNYIAIGVFPQTVTTTLYSGTGSQVRQDAYQYDKFGTYQNYYGATYPFSFGQKQYELEYDWGSNNPSSTVLRSTYYTNQWQSNGAYYAANLIDLPCLVTVFSGSQSETPPQPSCTAPAPPSNQVSQTSYAYDQSPSPSGAKGNLTSVTRWLNLGTSPVSKTTYNSSGMPIYKYDPLGNPTQIFYDSSGLYPSEIIYPQTGSVQHIEYFTYDDTTGELLSHTDQNGNKTSFNYDAMRRLKQTCYPDGGAGCPNSDTETFQYIDPVPPSNLPLPSFMFSKPLNSSSTFSETGLADSLGRKYQSQITSDSEGTIYADTRYDLLGRVASQSNPYRSVDDPTYGVTTFTYDALSRKTIQTQPDESKQQWCYLDLATNTQSNCNAQLAKTNGSTSTGSWVDFMDESGNDWQRNSDGLGRLASVMEPNGTTAAPSMQTTYTHDALGNLLNVAQPGNTSSDSPRQARTFNYDSLSRLNCASNPENSLNISGYTTYAPCPTTASTSYTAGTIAYSYNLDGDLLTRRQPEVDAVPASGPAPSQSINYCFDQLNRKVAEYTGSLVANCTSSSQITAANLLSAYTYDTTSLGTAPTYSIGHVTDEIEYNTGSAVWERSPYQYDTMGRLLDEQQCAFGSCATVFPFTYTYDYAGDVLSTSNGITPGSSNSPITIDYAYDSVARLSTVTGVTPTGGIWSGSLPATLYNVNEYGPAGMVSASYRGVNTKPLISRTYDNRLRVTSNIVYSATTQATGTITLACTSCTPGNSTVSVVIGGVSATSGTSTTLSGLASSLASVINSTDGMPATAKASSDVVTVTAIEYGKAGEVSLSASASSGAPFTVTTSGSTLTGDTDTTLYQYALTYQPNNNVATLNDTEMGNWTYTYDTLNRLIYAQASTAGIYTPWGTYKEQCWTYDGFGNRTGEGEMTAATTCPNPITGSNHSSWATYNTSNQLTANSTVSAFSYDDAGNTVNDGINKYVYDLDGRICAVTTVANGGAMTQYVYDAEGRRVGKGTITTWPAAGATCSAPTSANGFTLTTQYLRGEHGDQDTELNGSGVWQHTNVFAAGGLAATYDTGAAATLNFNLSDWLGTKRVETKSNGSLENWWKSDPFGAYQKPDIATSDDTEHHFTGKERDTESGNDYFGARYYESGIGRWVSPDWSMSPVPVPYSTYGDPQTLNLYQYLTDNPLGGTDPNGHWDPWQHVEIMEMAYSKVNLPWNERVILADRNRDGAGHNPYTGIVMHPFVWHAEQYSPGTQANHFLRDRNESQQAAYQHGVDRLRTDAAAIRGAILSGNLNAAISAEGDAQHLIQDSFAHTDRVGGNGAITHIQCFNCSGSADDHHHPDFRNDDGTLTPQARGSIDASADFIRLVQRSGNETDSQFNQDLNGYIGTHFQNKLPSDQSTSNH